MKIKKTQLIHLINEQKTINELSSIKSILEKAIDKIGVNHSIKNNKDNSFEVHFSSAKYKITIDKL